MSNRDKVTKLALSAMLVAVMLVLGFVESIIPLGIIMMGIPGIKIGLANSVLLFSLYWLGIPVSIALMVAKVLLSGFLFGNLDMIQYSFAGGVLSLFAMILLIFLVRGLSPVGVGIAGAVMHNVGQVMLAILKTNTSQLVYYMAVLVLVGIVTGAATGTVAQLLMKHLGHSQNQTLKIMGKSVIKNGPATLK